MKYPKFLSIGNWLFKHISPELFINNSSVVGGKVPENLYYAVSNDLNLSRDLRTYEGIIADGGQIPDDKELLRLFVSCT